MGLFKNAVETLPGVRGSELARSRGDTRLKRLALTAADAVFPAAVDLSAEGYPVASTAAFAEGVVRIPAVTIFAGANGAALGTALLPGPGTIAGGIAGAVVGNYVAGVAERAIVRVGIPIEKRVGPLYRRFFGNEK